MLPTDLQSIYHDLRSEADKTIVGLEIPFEMLVVALFSGGHVLLEGVPGTAKTLMAKTMARLVDARFARIQFTPDLMPSDIIGTNVFDINSGSFYLRKGPLFTQSALLEAMEERQINLEGQRFVLDPPFMVIATQNPIEYEGTYPLPEAQLDRFMFKVVVPYSSEETEIEVLRRYHHGFDPHDLDAAGLRAVVAAGQFGEIRAAIDAVKVEEGVLVYISKITTASRDSPDVVLGASLRAAAHVLLASKTYAALQGRDFVTPDDVKEIVPAVFRHRLILKPEAEIEGLDPDAVIRRILGRVEVPR